MKLSKIIFLVLLVMSSFIFAQTQTEKTKNFTQKSNFVEANGINHHYLEWGSGENVIVLIHGLSDSAEIWNDLALTLAKNYRVLALDRRGAGKSETAVNGYDAATLAKDVEKILDALKIKKAVVIGNSFGGNTALTLAANAPGKVKSLILIEGGFWEKREPTALSKCKDKAETDCLIANQIQQSVNEYNGAELYSKIAAPTLLMLGLPKELNKPNLSDEEKTNKKFFDEAVNYANNIAKNKLKKAKTVVVENAGHWTFKDQPQIVAAEIKKFINDN